MTDWPKDNEAALDAFYTRPDGSAKWEVTNLVYITAPWTMYLAGTKTELKRGIRVHKKVADDLNAIFHDIWIYYGKTQAAIEKVDLHQLGGAYYFRARRGSSRLSNHARGIAIDIDPLDNAMRKGNRGDMPQAVIAIFENHGWRWGGVYGDPMHFEAVWNGKPPKAAVVAPVAKPAVPPTQSVISPMAMKAAEIAKPLEKFMPKKYWDYGQWSIGYGENADKLPDDTVWTEPYAATRLADRFAGRAMRIMPLVKVPITTNQGAALILFTDNVGEGAFAKSTLLRKLNEKDYAGAAGQFESWVKAGGKVLAGLVKRRKLERALFETP